MKLALLMFATAAHAHWWCGDYSTHAWTIESKTIVRVAGACHATELQLGTVDGGAGWTGGFERAAEVETVWSVRHFDRCTGEYIGTTKHTDRHREMVRVEIENPNLRDPSAPSYIRQDAPLTDDEAQGERSEALRKCEALKAGASAGFAL